MFLFEEKGEIMKSFNPKETNVKKMNQIGFSRKYQYESGFDHDPVHTIPANTVSDMILFLQQFPKDMSVLASWEGQRVPFGNAKIIKDVNGDAALLINVDSGQYDCFEGELIYP